MEISLAQAKGRLPELLDRVDAGQEIILTRDGRQSIRLVAMPTEVEQIGGDWRRTSAEERLAKIRDIQARVRRKVLPGPDAQHAADFLYDEFGLPK